MGEKQGCGGEACIGCVLSTPGLGNELQPRPVPCPGVEPTTVPSQVSAPGNRATAARARPAVFTESELGWNRQPGTSLTVWLSIASISSLHCVRVWTCARP